MKTAATLLLAQTPDAAQFLQFWIIIGFLTMVGGQAATLIVMLSNRKQKREVSFGFEAPTKGDFEKHVEQNRREHENLFSKIGGIERGAGARMDALAHEWHKVMDDRFETLMASDKTDRSEIHRRINGLEKEMGGVLKAIEISNQLIAAVSSKVDRLAERKP